MECLAVFNRLIQRCVKNIASLETDQAAMRWVTKGFITFYCIIVTMFAYGTIFKMIPYEISVAPSYFSIFWRLCMFVYMFYSIIFHYYRCIYNEPIKVPQLGHNGRYCKKCNIVKCKLTHHCSTCDVCIYKLDHHCPWIGQCVGAHNQVHFFSFLVYMTVGCFLFFALASSFWMKHFEKSSNDGIIEMMKECKIWWIANINPMFILFICESNSFGYEITFMFGFFFIIFWLTLVFTIIQTYKISYGNHFYKDITSSNRLTLDQAIHNWRKFFGLRYEESFWKVFLLPVEREVMQYYDY